MRKRLAFLAGLTCLLLGSFTVLHTIPVHALSGSDWQAGHIFDDGLFTNSNSMNVQQIQAFLDKQIAAGGGCDTWGTQPASDWGRPDITRAQFATQVKGWPGPPYVCSNEYYEVPKTSPGSVIPDSSYNHYNATTKTLLPVPGGVSAAQLIYNAAQQYHINPMVLLVKIQTESSGPLTQDTWPLPSQYTYAMGAHCPDSGPGGSAQCDSNYSGFSIQISEAAALLRYYLDNMQQPWWPYKVPFATNSVLWNVAPSGCGAGNVYIASKATAALYTYTPYQPNGAALAHVSNTSSGGLGDGCSAYGNRNFWWWFSHWFGTTQSDSPYAWSLSSGSAYTDSARTVAYTNSPTIDMTPGSTAYATIKAINNGYQTWSQSVVHLGTSYPGDRASLFANSTWLSPQRVQMQETSVAPGDTGTFNFSLTAPTKPGTYVEHFSVVADGITWLNDPDFYYTINVTTPIQPTNNQNTSLTTGQYLNPGGRLMSPDSQSVLTLQSNGTVVLYSDFKPVWSNNIVNNNAGVLVLQSDGNLVEYDTSGHALWASGTGGSGNVLAMQTDGNVVMYSSGGSPLWSTSTGSTPGHLSKADSSVAPSGVLYPGQFMQTADRAYTLVLQAADGNLVEYDSAGHAIWASGTSGSGNALVMQTDGNLVMYSNSGKALWASGTGGSGNTFTLQSSGVLTITNGNNAVSWNNRTIVQAGQYIQTADRAYTLVLQAADGNLVEYDSAGHAIWASGTSGSGNVLILQRDGNMVIYNRSGHAVWASGTGGLGNVFALQSDGNMVVYGSSGRALWASR